MKKRMMRIIGLIFVSDVLLQFAGCTMGFDQNVAVFLRDLARDALAAFLF